MIDLPCEHAERSQLFEGLPLKEFIRRVCCWIADRGDTPCLMVRKPTRIALTVRSSSLPGYHSNALSARSGILYRAVKRRLVYG
jgi:hypothetical protein